MKFFSCRLFPLHTFKVFVGFHFQNWISNHLFANSILCAQKNFPSISSVPSFHCTSVLIPNPSLFAVSLGRHSCGRLGLRWTARTTSKSLILCLPSARVHSNGKARVPSLEGQQCKYKLFPLFWMLFVIDFECSGILIEIVLE